MTPSTHQNAKQNKSSSLHYHEVTDRFIPDTEDQIAKIAYYKAESRGFTPGHELDDWLEAEQEMTMKPEDEEEPNKNAPHSMLDTAMDFIFHGKE